MRIARIAAAAMLVLFCVCVQAAPQQQTKMTVTGTLSRAMAIGGESTGWSIQVDPEITVDGKPLHSIEISYKDTQKLEKLANKRVKATGKLTHQHGVETGDRPVLEVSSIKEIKSK
jgi:formylmethanofuran:tetrahydromethanopterin formyltransferase